VINSLFNCKIIFRNNLIEITDKSEFKNQEQTNQVFSEKWNKVNKDDDVQSLVDFQLNWFLKLYGFEGEDEFKKFLKDKYTILDAGCGLGYKAAWFAKLAPHATVIGMDYSESVNIASKNYDGISNLYFVRGDIANTSIKPDSIDFVCCDQVIMHTENPDYTFKHLSDITSKGGEFACYVYAKKALPRELLDDYFRVTAKNYNSEELWNMSKQLTQLGKILSELKVKFIAPDIPLLGIKGGEYDIQRFIYWNFLKCFWKEEWGTNLCDSTNFDWYSPSNAKRYNEQEYINLIKDNKLTIEFFHKEEACYSGRFKK
jgi:SAM-dependent methyltransferase